MSGTLIPPQMPTTPPHAFPGLYRLTVGQYDQMIRDGMIGENEPVELIEGLLVTKVGRNRPHIVAAKIGFEALTRVVPAGWHVAKEDPLVISNWSKPEPDLAIVRGNAKDYLERDVAAADVELVVEIAETTLAADRSEMSKVYARAGIAVSWIVNLVDRQIEVYTTASPEGYQSRRDFTRGQDVPVTIAGRESGRIPVAEFLP
jgi:Uma2 family endonuclease